MRIEAALLLSLWPALALGQEAGPLSAIDWLSQSLVTPVA